MSPGNIEKFELSKRERPGLPVSTTSILENFIRDSPPDIPNVALQERRVRLRKHDKTVEELRRWAKSRGRSTVAKALLRGFWNGVKIRMPPERNIYSSISHFFPPRMDIQVIVCDFGDNRAERHEVPLGDIEMSR